MHKIAIKNKYVQTNPMSKHIDNNETIMHNMKIEENMDWKKLPNYRGKHRQCMKINPTIIY